MKKAIFIMVMLIILSALAQTPTNLEQAKRAANQSNKPILLEFFQPDCEFCQLAAQDFANNDTIKTLLQSVVYYPMDVNFPKGESLSTSYYVENIFPVFVLCDSSGDIIFHWTGYTNVSLFGRSLQEGLSNPITIKSRYEMLNNSPTLDNITTLAEYNNEIGENVKAAELYRQAQEIQKGSDYLYNIFENMANAVWKGKSSFEQFLKSADDVLAAKSGNVSNVAGVGIIVTRVARKVGRTDDIAKYLQAGIDITDSREDKKSKDQHTTLIADQALYVKKDTAGAISIKKESLGPDWGKKPQIFYSFAKWCLERNIDLSEAEKFASKAIEGSTEGKFRASILVTLADIYKARGKTDDAVKTMELAIQQDPQNSYYKTKLTEMQTKQGVK
jgi:tetratricopeptide (TPR) repeat protein